MYVYCISYPFYLNSVFLVPLSLALLRVMSKQYLYIYSFDDVPLLFDSKENIIIQTVILTRSQNWCQTLSSYAVFLAISQPQLLVTDQTRRLFKYKNLCNIFLFCEFFSKFQCIHFFSRGDKKYQPRNCVQLLISGEYCQEATSKTNIRDQLCMYAEKRMS